MVHYHRVKQGECLSSIAAKYRISDWRQIYNHPENAEIKRKRPNPNVIYPGDRLFIPEVQLRNVDAPTKMRHRFVLRAQPTVIRLLVQDEERRPACGKRYRLEIGGEIREGETNQEALIEHKVPATAEEGTLTVFLDDDAPEHAYSWPLSIGFLDPVDEITGIQARLNNLGFLCGPVDGILGSKTRAAVRAFQQEFGLTVDGIAGLQTQSKLVDLHGC